MGSFELWTYYLCGYVFVYMLHIADMRREKIRNKVQKQYNDNVRILNIAKKGVFYLILFSPCLLFLQVVKNVLACKETVSCKRKVECLHISVADSYLFSPNILSSTLVFLGKWDNPGWHKKGWINNNWCNFPKWVILSILTSYTAVSKVIRWCECECEQHEEG